MAISSSSRNLAVYFLVLAAVAVPTLVILAPDVMDESKLGLALRVTARLAFLIYILVFVTRPLRQIAPLPLTKALFRNRRYIGISFAAVMTTHLALISWLLLYVVDEGRTLTSLTPGIVTYMLVTLMLVTSFDAPARALGSKNWRRLHKTGHRAPLSASREPRCWPDRWRDATRAEGNGPVLGEARNKVATRSGRNPKGRGLLHDWQGGYAKTVSGYGKRV